MINLCLDSGAFSAFTCGKPVDLKAYTKFCLEQERYIKLVVNLDVINPGNPEGAAKAGRDNFLQMRDAGVKAMPVFHAREAYKWLDLMIDECDYVGLSGTSLVSPLEDRAWSRITWNYITDNLGYPISKFHSFGNTSLYTLSTYPYYSADSSTWIVQSGRAARIRLKGKIYQLRSNMISDPNFISVNDAPLKKQAWEGEIRLLGLNPDQVMSVVTSATEMAMIRSYLVASDTLRLQEATADVTFYKARNPLIGSKKKLTGGTAREGACKIYFVVSPSAFHFNAPIIAALGIKNVLVSYFYVSTATKNFWQEKMIPFLEDPIGFCSTDKKISKFWQKLQEVTIRQEETEMATIGA